MSDMYFPTEFSENELDQLSRVDAVNIIPGELERQVRMGRLGNFESAFLWRIY